MKNWAMAAVLFAMMSIAVAGRAAQSDVPFTRQGWEVGGEAATYHYEEPDFAKLSGTRGGVVAAYTAANPDVSSNPGRIFSRLDGRVSYGSLKYEGSGTQDGNTDWIFEARGVIGRDFLVSENVVLAPYIGLGYRHLYNDLRGTSSTGAVGYRRYSHYVYAPVGVTLRMRTGSRWGFAPTFEYDAFLGGRQYSKLSDAGTALSDASNTQHDGYGYRVYLMVESANWSFGPWLHYWSIKDSDVVPIGLGFAGLEPANWTREYGLELRYRF